MCVSVEMNKAYILSLYLRDYLNLSIYKIIKYTPIQAYFTIEKFASSPFTFMKDLHWYLFEQIKSRENFWFFKESWKL